jgi:hypothetical protein
MAHAAISAPRYFSSVPLTSQDVWNDCVANSWPLPNSSASFSVESFGLASAALSLRNCHIWTPVLAVEMSACFCLPKQIWISCIRATDIRRYLLIFLFVHLPIATDHQGDQDLWPRLDAPHFTVRRDQDHLFIHHQPP